MRLCASIDGPITQFFHMAVSRQTLGNESARRAPEPAILETALLEPLAKLKWMSHPHKVRTGWEGERLANYLLSRFSFLALRLPWMPQPIALVDISGILPKNQMLHASSLSQEAWREPGRPPR
jgi:hypothetical protein